MCLTALGLRGDVWPNRQFCFDLTFEHIEAEVEQKKVRGTDTVLL
jgi:hypothetical protein